MAQCEIIDTFPAFSSFWEAARQQPVRAQVEAWASGYMGAWPELRAKQQDSYAEENADWREIARERVFPFLDQRLPAMTTARDHLLDLCPSVHELARRTLGFERDLVCVIYVGIGCGAGWATQYQEKPAVLLGLENVAECGWSGRETLRGLLAHEIGHLVHTHWRAAGGKRDGSGPWWDLYSEGFAQRCEHRVLGRDTWHMNNGEGVANWRAWCRENRSWLATWFLRTVDAEESVRPFFGSWFEIRGHSQTGYYLGHELIRALEKRMSLEEIALLDGSEAELRPMLEELSG